jgi:REP element-mobilizing transposase RayT
LHNRTIEFHHQLWDLIAVVVDYLDRMKLSWNHTFERNRGLKGNSGYRLPREFPYLKHKYFWGSGLWSPVYYFDGVGERTCSEIDVYVRNQGKKTTNAK